MNAPRVRRRTLLVGAALAGAAALGAQRPAPVPRGLDTATVNPPVPVVAVGEGADFATALAGAVRMAVESGAGLTLASSITTRGDHVVADSIHAVSRGVVTRYALLDSSRGGAGLRVRILAMVSRIREQPLTTSSGARVAVPGALWAAGRALDAERARQEGEILGQIFGDVRRQPSLYSYRIRAGPPVADGARVRLRLQLIRVPNANYAAAVNRVAAVAGAVAGPSGDRVLRYPPTAAEVAMVRPCVSLCGPDERLLLDARAPLAPTDSFAGFDPPLVTTALPARVPALFPSLATAGGFAVGFVDRAAHRVRYVHVRSTSAYFTLVDYLRTSVDEARFRLRVGDVVLPLRERFRAAWTGAPAPALLTADSTDSAASLRVRLVRGFRERTAGGPGAASVAGSRDVLVWVPVGDSVRADTATLDLWLTHRQLAALGTLSVEPLETTRRLLPVTCTAEPARWPDGTTTTLRLCRRPAPVDDTWRPVPDGAP